jgi:hypothetical protein
MRLARLTTNETLKKTEYFIPSHIRRLRGAPEDTSEILVEDQGGEGLVWLRLDMSRGAAYDEINRALIDAAMTADDLDPEPIRSALLNELNLCPKCDGNPQGNLQDIPPDKARAIIFCPSCNPDMILHPNQYFYAIGWGPDRESALAQAVKRWNKITRDPAEADPDDPLDRR